ncbi:hypothetical protein BDE36_1427 [Arcticibacter tournemirensis]|uniref:Uncharacterized protein n=1 Tax=Arcticibacter tournemirensis TaxID=699437 RepID=A0A5M9HC73_9SPHI|nr:hypothetical protein [Arcticibacter tournemirensis]KAA8482914.1 hypothetical protein F1649_10540 [Arcticibacter tournemirensis]TQM49702.1 hypothetical protein BDE36_1427 [Arcticibacter tournemirensis]
MTGLQASAVHNMVLDTAKGVQVAGFINHTEGPVRGIQVAGLHNYARKLQGIQIGLVNMADTSEGASIGLVNIVRNGHYRISIAANDAMNTNFSLQTGTSRFYSAIKAGLNINPSEKMYAFGLGIGREFFPLRKLSLLTGIDYMIANADGSWDGRWVRFETTLNLKLFNRLEVFAGPVFNHFRYSGSYAAGGYKNIVHAPVYKEPDEIYTSQPPLMNSHPQRNWIGWQGGVALRSSFKAPVHPVSSLTDRNTNWSLEVGISGGIAWDYPYGFASGADVRLIRHLGGNIDAIFTAGVVRLAVASGDISSRIAISTPGKVYYISFIDRTFLGVPVKGGVRALLGRSFYVAGEAGIGFCNSDGIVFEDPETPEEIKHKVNTWVPGNTSFVYSPSLGFAFRNGLDLAFKFEDFAKYPVTKQFAVRLAYNLKIK